MNDCVINIISLKNENMSKSESTHVLYFVFKLFYLFCYRSNYQEDKGLGSHLNGDLIVPVPN